MVSSLTENLTNITNPNTSASEIKSAVQGILDENEKSTGSKKLAESARKSLIQRLEINYSDEGSAKSIKDLLKEYTDSISKNINKISEDNKNNNNIKIDKISLKDVIKNMANKNLSKSTYESVGMGEYYNLKSLMSLSQGITKYNQNNSAFSIAKAGISMSNFTIKV